MLSRLSGNTIAVINFIFWGLLPLYYQFLTVDNIFELLSIRVLASLPVFAVVFYWLKMPWPPWRTILADKQSFFMAIIATFVLTISWCTYTYAITHNKVLEASLGFFIAPLFAIAFGIIVQREKPTIWQGMAILCAVIGVTYQIIAYQKLPILSLTMAVFFALYGLCKKYSRYDMLFSVALETIILAPICLIYFLYLVANDQSQFMQSDMTTVCLFLGAAPMTIIPYLLYTLAVQKTSLTMIGLLHFIEPSLQFVLALWVFHESFDTIKAVSFSIIWLGLIICSLPAIMKLIHQKSPNTPPVN